MYSNWKGYFTVKYWIISNTNYLTYLSINVFLNFLSYQSKGQTIQSVTQIELARLATG